MRASTDPGPVYRDMREYLAEFDRRGLLRRVTRRTNEDTEVMPLVRWQFRGLDAAQRTGWLFENLTDSRGRRFDASVAVAILGASPQVYAAAMGRAGSGSGFDGASPGGGDVTKRVLGDREVQAERAYHLALDGDPGDRIIVATALVEGVKLVTKDGRITDSGIVPVVW